MKLRRVKFLLKACLVMAAVWQPSLAFAVELAAVAAQGAIEPQHSATRALLVTDDDFFDDAVRRLTDSQHRSVFGVDRTPPGAEAKTVAVSKRANLKRLKELTDEQAAPLITAALPLFVARQTECSAKRPRIHSVGWSATFTFESAQSARPTGAGKRAVRIPVEGFDLDPPCTSIDVTIEGTVPLSRGSAADFDLTKTSDDQKDGLNIILLEPFIDRLQTGDKVAIKVMASNKFMPPGDRKAAGEQNKYRLKSVVRRVFVAYETETYRREVLRSRISPDDINAFPLPENDAKALFGPLIARNYFVVRVSVRNTRNDAKVISTGMIRATGTAMIDSKVDAGPMFSVPISVVPHSLKQIYTVLTDEESDQPRHRIFRSLEFVGALAAGAQGVFNFGAQAAKNVALFAGIVVPEGKKLWPDRWPGYQRNIVNYAMQDLVKVPANSVIDHKFLFFSKKELDGLVSDPNLFKTLDPAEQAFSWMKSGDRRSNAKPDAFVIALAFDTLDIRFETLPAVVEFSARDLVRDLVWQSSEHVRALEASKPWGGPALATIKLGLYSQADSSTVLKALAALADLKKPKGDGKGDPDLAVTAELADSLLKLAQAIEPVVSATALKADLYAADAKFGLASVLRARARVGELVQRVNAGTDAELMKEEIYRLDRTVQSSRALLDFYLAVANALHEHADAIDRISKASDSKTLSAEQRQFVKGFNVSITALLADLASKRPLQASLEFAAP